MQPSQDVPEEQDDLEPVLHRWGEVTLVPSSADGETALPPYVVCDALSTTSLVAFVQARALRDLAIAGFMVAGPVGMLVAGAVDALRRSVKKKDAMVSINKLRRAADAGDAIVVPKRSLRADARPVKRGLIGPHYACGTFRSEEFSHKGRSYAGLITQISYANAKEISKSFGALIGTTVPILETMNLKDWVINTPEGRATEKTGWKREVLKLQRLARDASRVD